MYKPNYIPKGSKDDALIDRINQELATIGRTPQGATTVVRNIVVTGGGGGGSVVFEGSTAFGTMTTVTGAGIITVNFTPAMPSGAFNVMTFFQATNGKTSIAKWLTNQNTVSSFQVQVPEAGLLFCVCAMRV
jgi:hypothetical protein